MEKKVSVINGFSTLCSFLFSFSSSASFSVSDSPASTISIWSVGSTHAMADSPKNKPVNARHITKTTLGLLKKHINALSDEDCFMKTQGKRKLPLKSFYAGKRMYNCGRTDVIMNSRRKFIRQSVALAATSAVLPSACAEGKSETAQNNKGPILLSTWFHGMPANEKGMDVLSSGGSILDAVEQGVMVVEANPEYESVGFGGLPDRDGNVTLDACIMDAEGNAGSVCFLQNIKHPISVARKVMEETPHVMLAGNGARKFALEQGFLEEDLMTDNSRKKWEKWKLKSKYEPKVNWENHDTIGMIGMDENGDLAGSCTTSGMAFKLHGRVGDSPIIGAGLFVDNEVGAAVATGNGELMMKTLGSFLIVELMRNGRSAQEACEEAIDRIMKRYDTSDMQVGYLALSKAGAVGSMAIKSGFNFAETSNGKTELKDSNYLEEWGN